jgi:hypothetical protein
MSLFDKSAADALAVEVEKLIERKIIDSRSPAADALLNYRDGKIQGPHLSQEEGFSSWMTGRPFFSNHIGAKSCTNQWTCAPCKHFRIAGADDGECLAGVEHVPPEGCSMFTPIQIKKDHP